MSTAPLNIMSGPVTAIPLDNLGERLVLDSRADRQSRLVLEDYCLERRIQGGSARLRWLYLKPSAFEVQRTLFVVGHETVYEANRENENGAPIWGGWFRWWNDAKPWLEMHPSADWVRAIRPMGNYKPRFGEVLIVRRFGSKGHGSKLEARCGILGCTCPVGEVTKKKEAAAKTEADRKFHESFEDAAAGWYRAGRPAR